MKIKKYKELLLITFLSLIINFSTINTFPVLDRDEARYVQATTQMLESRDYNSIKFQDEYRSKKPIGIYWLQAASVNLFSFMKNDADPHKKANNIWKYRFVSSVFSLFTCLALFLLASKFFDRKTAFFSSLALQCTLLFIIESHIAKTDAVLLTCSVFSMFLLLGYYKKKLTKKYDLFFFLFWSSLGISVLIKGPVLIFIVLTTVSFLLFFDKERKWVFATNPLIGIIIIIIIIMPWFLSLSGGEQSNLLHEGLKKDLLDKVLSAQEKHGAFFGAHTLSILILFFPMSLFLFPSILKNIKDYRSENNFFLLAFILPNLIVFEFIPTKLPHYTLPLYPALSLFIGNYIVAQKSHNLTKKASIKIINNLLYIFIISILSCAIFIAIKDYSSLLQNYIFIAFIVFLIYLFSIFLNARLNKFQIFYYQVFLACFTSIFIFAILLPKLDKIWISQNIYNVINKDNNRFKSENIAAIGYNEPSLIFLLGTKTNILRGLKEDFFEKRIYKYIIVEEKYLDDFNNFLKDSKNEYVILNKIEGFNMARGRWLNTIIFKLKAE